MLKAISRFDKVDHLIHVDRCIRKEFIACKVERDGLASGFAVVIQASRRRIRCLSIVGLLSERPGTKLPKKNDKPYSILSGFLLHDLAITVKAYNCRQSKGKVMQELSLRIDPFQ